VAALALAVLCGWRAVEHRRFARGLLGGRPPVSTTIEYEAAHWLSGNLPGRRVFLPGSLAQWLNAFSAVPQYAGGSWSTRINEIQEPGIYVVQIGEKNADESIDWLKAYGEHAVAVTGPGSREFWKPYPNPAKFEGRLPALWREPGTVIYAVPQESDSLAWVIPRGTHGLHQYAAALDTPAEFHWRGGDAAEIRATLIEGQAISVQISYHSGWKSSTPVLRDDLGQIRLEPACRGDCRIELRYDSGIELKFCRIASAAAVVALAALGLRRR
jgi:hypothetical protein